MKNTIKILFTLLLLTGLTSCSDDDDGTSDGPTGNSKTYSLGSVADPSISGTATFIENGNGTITIELDIFGTPDGGMHPAHIHFNTAAEGGDIALTLGTVDGTTGFSTITTGELDNGDAISYNELLTFDGYINVHLSPSELTTIVAQGDIGQNELTNESVVYSLDELNSSGVSGSLTFTERVNGEALAVIDLDNTVSGSMHPAHIHAGSVITAPGAIIFTFNMVDGDTGMSMTNVTELDDNSDFNFSDALTVNGYVNIHLSPADLTVVAQSDIGIN